MVTDVQFLEPMPAVLGNEWNVPWRHIKPERQEQIWRYMEDLRDYFQLPFIPHLKQAQLYLHPARGSDQPLLFGGSMRGGKSMSLCGKAISLARTVQNGRCLMGRRTLTAFHDTTLNTLLELADTVKEFDHNKSSHTLQHRQTGFEIKYAQFGRKEDLERLGSSEYLHIMMDEAPEVQRDVFEMLQTRLSHKLGYQLDVMGFWLTGNPTPGWIKQDFVKKPRDGFHYLPALVEDNPFVPERYIEEQRANLPPERFNAWILGDWDAFIPEMAALPMDLVRAAMGRTEEPDYYDHFWGIDVGAGRGGDYTAVWQRIGMLFRPVMPKRNDLSIDEQGDWIIGAYWARSQRPRQINIDIDGLGVGLQDVLVRAQLDGKLPKPPELVVIGVHAEGKPTQEQPIENPLRYANVKSECFFKFRHILEQNRGDLPEQDEDLFGELTTPYYDTPGGRIIIESKTDVKRRLGHSPDDGDGLLLTMYEGRHDEIAGRAGREPLAVTPEQEALLAAKRAREEREAAFRQAAVNLGIASAPPPGAKPRGKRNLPY